MYFLSFDCATKSLAFIIAYVNVNKESLQETSKQLMNTELTCDEFNKIKSNLISIIDGETVDLFPNIPDANIPTVERIKALVFYVRNRILPKLNSSKLDKTKLKVLIEFQMGANPKARMIFAALIAIFADYDVKLVNPSLKNKIHFSEDGKHKHFIKKYSQLYSANKAHAKYNFELVENMFGSNIKATSAEKGHIADAFMQILGICRS